MKSPSRSVITLGLGLLGLSLMIASTEARQFRRMEPIPVAPKVLENSGPRAMAPGPDIQLLPVDDLQPIDEEIIREALQKIVDGWNQGGLEEYLDEYFPQRRELLDTLNRDIPSDAVLELIAVQNISTISQAWGNQQPPERSQISTVIATVSLQLRFNDPLKGLITMPHRSQFYLRVVETE